MTSGPGVLVGGVHLDDFGLVADLEDSTIWRRVGYSGDYEATWTWAVASDFSAPWFAPGALVQIIESGREVWRGFLGDPEPGDVVRCRAFGSGADAENYICPSPTAGNMDARVDAAISRGLRFTRPASINGPILVTLASPTEPVQLDQALDNLGDATGKIWWVSRGALSMRTVPTGVDWVMAPDSAYLLSTDAEFASALIGFYATAVDGSGQPSAWSTVTVEDPAMITKFGRHERTVDLTPLGAVSASNAFLTTQNVFALTGGRMAFTNAFEMNDLNSGSALNGVPAPMSVRAGQRVVVPSISTTRTGVTYQEATPVTLGKVTRKHAARKAVCEPEGMVARDFASAFSPQQVVKTGMWRLAGWRAA